MIFSITGNSRCYSWHSHVDGSNVTVQVVSPLPPPTHHGTRLLPVFYPHCRSRCKFPRSPVTFFISSFPSSSSSCSSLSLWKKEWKNDESRTREMGVGARINIDAFLDCSPIWRQMGASHTLDFEFFFLFFFLIGFLYLTLTVLWQPLSYCYR